MQDRVQDRVSGRAYRFSVTGFKSFKFGDQRLWYRVSDTESTV